MASQQTKLDVRLPVGWNQRPHHDGPLTYSPKPDDSAGVLQVSRLPDKDYGFITGRDTLGPLAAEMGARLGWGTALGEKDAPCAMGRLGLALFASEEFPAMFLFVTASDSAAYMWTWLGPSAQADEVKQALQVVVEATEAKLPRNPAVDAFVASLDGISLVRGEMRKGTSPDKIYVAVFMDGEGKVSADERPVLGGRFSILEPAGSDGLRLQCRFAPDPAQVVLVTTTADHEKVRVHVARDGKAAPSQPDRLRAAQLWSLIGEQIAAPYEPAVCEAVVIGTQLVKTSAYFWNPGQGSWVLLKTTAPDELYLAFDVETGRIELFPKTPMQPNEAARALFRAL